MASVKGRMVQWICPVTGKRKTKTLGSPALAKRFASDRETEHDLIRGRFIDPQTLEQGKYLWTSLDDAFNEYESELELRRVSKAHKKERVRVLKAAQKGCQAQLVADLNAESLRRFLNRVNRQGKSARTLNGYITAVSAFFQWLVEMNRVDRNPFARFKGWDESKDKREPSRALAFTESEAILAVAGARKLYYLFRLRTGLRTKECRRLLWSDIDLKAKVLNLRAEVTKNGHEDQLPLSDDLCAELSRVLAFPAAPVFKTLPTLKTWKRDIERAKIEYDTRDGQVDMKCTRNTFDADLMRAGIDPVMVSLLMRHSPKGGMKLTLQRYGDPGALLEQKRWAIARLNRWHQKQQARAAVS